MKWIVIGGAVLVGALVLWAVLGKKTRAADRVSEAEEERTIDLTFAETPPLQMDLVLESMRNERDIGRSIGTSPIGVGGPGLTGTVRF